jgi:hypothetical protein
MKARLDHVRSASSDHSGALVGFTHERNSDEPYLGRCWDDVNFDSCEAAEIRGTIATVPPAASNDFRDRSPARCNKIRCMY